MQQSLVRSIVPYAVGLAVAAALYVYIGDLDYTPRAGQLGPDVWPRMALALMAASCVFEIGRRAIVGNKDSRGIIEALDREEQTEEPEPSYPWLLAGGIALVSVYAITVPVLGFLFATFLFLAAFMYLGRYRNHRVLWLTSAAVTILCGILFLRIAYVSLPRGIAPFDRITDLFFLIPGF